MKRYAQAESGMTLIELVIAIAITAAVGLISAQLLSTMMTNDQMISEHQANSLRLDRALRIIHSDLETLIPNQSITTAADSGIPGLLLEFSHLDTRPTNSGDISSQERVRYLLDGTELIRYSSAVPAIVDEDHWSEVVLLNDVESVDIAYWQDDRWSDQISDSLPQGVRIKLLSSKWDTLELVSLLDFEGSAE
jgi:general secretion pathway protein J